MSAVEDAARVLMDREGVPEDYAYGFAQTLAEAGLLRPDRDTRTAVPPGPCWHDSGITWPGQNATVRCELRAGHLGAHEADRGSLGGTAVWPADEVPS